MITEKVDPDHEETALSSESSLANSVSANSRSLRSRARYRNAGLAFLSALVARAVGLVAQVISVKLTLSYLGTERYGVWVTISSLTSFLIFADLGMGNGLLNALSQADGRKDRAAARIHVTSALFLLAAVALVVITAGAVLSRLIDWDTLLRIPAAYQGRNEVRDALLVCLILTAVSLPLSVVQKIQLAHQEGYAGNLWQVGGSIASFLGMILAIHFKTGLAWLAVALTGGSVLASALNSFYQFRWVRPWLRPSLRQFDVATSRLLLTSGLAFLIIQLTSAALNADTILINQVRGPGSVAQYAIVMQIFTISSLITMLALTQFWPAYTEALACGDLAWVKLALRRCCVLSFALSSTTCGIMALTGPWIVERWLNGRVSPSPVLFWTMALQTVIVTSTHPLGILLMASGRLRFSVVSGLVLLPAALGTKMLLLENGHLEQIPIAHAVTYLVFITIPAVIYVSRRVLSPYQV